MKNFLALSFVVVFLAACSAYTWEHTRIPSPLPGRDYGGEQWRDRVKAW